MDRLSLGEIRGLGLNSQIDKDASKVSFYLKENYSKSLVIDFLESAVQRFPIEYLNKNKMNKWTAFIFFVTGQHIFPEAINESVKQELLLALKNFMEVGSLYPGYLSNVDEIKREYSEKLEDEYRVLAISHSQGGLFMNDAYQRVVTSRKEKYLAGHI